MWCIHFTLYLLVQWSFQTVAVRDDSDNGQLEQLERETDQADSNTSVQICCCMVSSKSWAASGVDGWYPYVGRSNVAPSLYSNGEWVLNMESGSVPQVTCSTNKKKTVLSIFRTEQARADGQEEWRIRSCVYRQDKCTWAFGSRYDKYIDSDTGNFKLCEPTFRDNPIHESDSDLYPSVDTKFGYTPPRACTQAIIGNW
eukprot:TRINITY_DN41666_c0_g1_i1.p1 TRINITY_DN41666_c0_g1~~TRINITY_DN41666_c0_g1_i1.p1  ORF type:complete len:199 (-),score=11.23 TRINITY_DN41666_c0_g1_i1:175-771(-)